MRCKKHAGDLTSTVGVCASCLRERLLLIIAAQSHPQLARQHSASDDYRKSDAHPPPLLFPRSVSPYVARRKSDGASHHHLRFYSTPQVGPSSTAAAAAFSASRTFRSKQGRFSLLSNLFRSRSGKLNPDPAAPAVPSRNSSDASSSSPSWFSTVFSPQRKKHSAHCSTEYSGRRPRRRMDRGMSPARDADCEADFEDPPSGTGSSPEWWKRTPASAARRGKGGHMSGLAFCLSPLVRASPSRQWNQKKGGLPPDLGYSGEVRVAVKPHLSTAASFCANRSRKLCDLGRVNHNR